MGKRTPFRINTYGLVLLAVSAAFSGPINAAAGRVDFATGGATISNAKGQQQPLAKGVELNSGDTIRTDAGGRAQIRFPDGAYVSLQPNTEFSVKEYNFDGKADGTERGFFALAKGAMRAVTGLIGRVNKNRYQISTPTATIGIRGTGGLISIENDGSTLVTGTSGIWTISNASGTIDVPAGTAGKAPAAPNQPPQQTTEKPSTGPTPPPTTQPPYTQADQRSPDGTSTAVTTPPIVPLQSGSGYAAAVAYTPNFGGATSVQSNLDAVFTSTGQLTDIQTSTPSFGFGFTLVNGSHAEFGTDGVLAWGRWIGSVNQNCDCSNPQVYGADQGLHYVVGIPAPVSSLPTNNGTYTFNTILGATSPTYANGGAPIGTLNSASLTANFFTGVVGVSIAVTDGNGVAYNGSASGTMNTSVPGALFNASGPGSSATGCPNGCGFSANGFFAGNGATHAGVSYGFTNTAQGDLVGAAALKR